MKSLLKPTCVLALVGAAASISAQSTLNYVVSDAGGGNSLVIWDATGSITTSPGAIWQLAGGLGGLPVNTPGIYVDSYAGSGGPQPIPTLDGSYFHNTELNGNFPIKLYATINRTGSSDDSFALISLPATISTGQHIIYHAGGQSALIPVPFSDFNPGVYTSVYPAGTFLDTATTVNLTVVPEPSTLALSAVGGLSGLLLFRRRK